MQGLGAAEMHSGSPSGVCQISPLVASPIHFTFPPRVMPSFSLFPPGLSLCFYFFPPGLCIRFHLFSPQGYAFVQFTSPFDARSACLGEDAKSLCGQTLDVNMVSEPKAHISKVKARRNRKKEPKDNDNNARR